MMCKRNVHVDTTLWTLFLLPFFTISNIEAQRIPEDVSGGANQTYIVESGTLIPPVVSYGGNFLFYNVWPQGVWSYVMTGHLREQCGMVLTSALHTPTQKFRVCRQYQGRFCKGNCGFPNGKFCTLAAEKTCPPADGVTKANITILEDFPSPTESHSRLANPQVTKIMTFCCFDTGSVDTPALFPNDNTFGLWMRDGEGCQKMSGMVNKQIEYDLGPVTSSKGGPYLKNNKITLCDYVPKSRDCGGVIQLGNDDNVNSKDIGIKMDESISRDCLWLIQGPNDKNGMLRLEFKTFSISFDEGKCIDSVQINYHNEPKLGNRVCGGKPTMNYRSFTNTMWIRFVTESDSKSYFTANVKFMPDGTFDKATDCYDRKKQGFCEKYKAEAAEQCALTCQLKTNGNKEKACGGLIKLNEIQTFTLIEPKTDVTKECLWVIEAPSDSKALVLDFKEFEVMDKDELVVIPRNPQLVGTRLTNKNYPKPSVITESSIIIKLTCEKKCESYFQATITWIPRPKWCYHPDDKGLSYGGKVYYTEKSNPCIHWKHAVNCKHNPYNGPSVYKNLEENYCRNPDDNSRPWCYVDKDTCKQEHCDVCQWATPQDKDPNCIDLVKKGICDNKIEALKCHKSCLKKISKSPKPHTSHKCKGYKIDKDGYEMDTHKKYHYKVGEIRKYRCMVDSSRWEEKMCGTNKRWILIWSQCTKCPPGYWYNRRYKKCYTAIVDKGETSEEMEQKCNNTDGALFTTYDIDEFILISNLMGKIVASRTLDVINKGLIDTSSERDVYHLNKDVPALSTPLDIQAGYRYEYKWFGGLSAGAFPCYTVPKKMYDCGNSVKRCHLLLEDEKSCNANPILKNLCDGTCED